jgi:hypothetical protein
MRPGDILLLVDDGENTCAIYRAIDWVQWMAGAVCDTSQGRSDTVHGAVWVKSPTNPGNVSPRGEGEPEIVEAAGYLGRVHGTAAPIGLYKVIRPKDANLGDWAAQAAMCIAQPRHVAYDYWSSAWSGLRNSAFGASAAAQAAHFQSVALSERPDIAKLFCIQTILASYQGVAPDVGVDIEGGALALDAKRTSPRKLEHSLALDEAFNHIGHLRIRKENVLYEELPAGGCDEVGSTD